MKNLFHLAFPVHNLDAAREFYAGILECEEGRSSDSWIDFDLYGHQIVTHLAPDSAGVKAENHVDADHVPVPHFGMSCRWTTGRLWQKSLPRRASNL